MEGEIKKPRGLFHRHAAMNMKVWFGGVYVHRLVGLPAKGPVCKILKDAGELPKNMAVQDGG